MNPRSINVILTALCLGLLGTMGYMAYLMKISPELTPYGSKSMIVTNTVTQISVRKVLSDPTNFLANLLEKHEKTLWMLQAHLDRNGPTPHPVEQPAKPERGIETVAVVVEPLNRIDEGVSTTPPASSDLRKACGPQRLAGSGEP